MANPYIGFRCPQDIYDALEKYLVETQQEKSEFLIGLIRKDLGIAKVETLIEKVESLDIRVSKIESRLDAD
jgi:hypothetical protein